MNTTTNIHDKFFGNIRYVAPEIFKASQSKVPYTKDLYTKHSDMFSLGVLLWQISSGKIPFDDQDNNVLFITIISGFRKEKTPRILDTPDEYYNLYNECWNDEPEKRRNIEH